MFITVKKHNQLMHEQAVIHEKEIKELLKTRNEAQDLKSILEKVSSMRINDMSFTMTGGNFHVSVPDNVLQYVDDILGGEVIKQEAVKCILIDPKGNITTGLTGRRADKGYTYKLVRN